MTPPNNLDLHGNFQTFAPAAILTEIRQARLNGSLRLALGEQKTIVYFRGGKIIFAISNARSSRLYTILQRENKLAKFSLDGFTDFANDRNFADFLLEKKLLSAAEIDMLFVFQIENILREFLPWDAGEWTFRPLARLRESIDFTVNTEKILIEEARRLSPETLGKQFSPNSGEHFLAVPVKNSPLQLFPQEAFILSRFAGASLTIAEILAVSVLPEMVTRQTVYILWLGGLLVRGGWNAAFSAKKIEAILAAKISLVKEAVNAAPPVPKIVETPPTDLVAEDVPVEELTIEEYLERIENAENFYEVLGVEARVSQETIKPVYFQLAKIIHPDKFYKAADEHLHRRVQTAFTRISQAYEMLKIKQSREAYDFKIRKELAEKEKLRDVSAEEITNRQQNTQAVENFEQGFTALMDENYEEALPNLARAVHLSPETARFHAYYGKALSVVEKYRHKAESELQTAIKLDAQNPTFRIMLAEFFVQYNLLKRAEGELTRLLTSFPDNKEARLLLDSLTKK